MYHINEAVNFFTTSNVGFVAHNYNKSQCFGELVAKLLLILVV